MDVNLNTGLVALLGMQVLSVDADSCVLRWTVGPEHHQPFGITHGGVHCSAVETAASAGPVATSPVWPAALRARGKTTEKPAPAQAKPTRAKPGSPTAKAQPSPRAATAPQKRTRRVGPNLSVRPSPKRRPRAIVREKAA